MKHSRPVLAVLAVLALGTWAALASACENKASASAAAASSKSSGCSSHSKSSTAKAKSADTPARSFDAVTLSAPGGARSVDAVLVGSGAGCSHGTASAAGTATIAGSGSCSGHGAAKTADSYKHANCDACADMAFCDGEVKSMGATVQVVPLKNGVMYVYTALDANKVHAVQASMGQRNDRMATLMAAGDKAHLCPSCKSVRGAIASGKLNRELVNIEGGCLTLMTSNDPATVAKIYTLAGLKGPMSAKI